MPPSKKIDAGATIRHWLFKSEPDVFSWEMLKARGPAGEPWDGVRNYQARNNMRAMKPGDLGFFYHSNEGKEIVGILEVSALAHPDPKDGTGTWECVDVRAVRDMPRPVSLVAIKDNPKLAKMMLVVNSRLSVQPVTCVRMERGLPHGRARRKEAQGRMSAAHQLRLDPGDRTSAEAFIRANTKLLRPPLVPEIALHLAEESLAIWQKTEDELGEMNVPPPYWAFAWAGGQALARFLLDTPQHVAGRRVLDLGSGSRPVGDRRREGRRGQRACRRHRPDGAGRDQAQCGGERGHDRNDGGGSARQPAR